jgi:hypothetical protein
VILKGMTPLLDMSGPPESFPPPVAIVHSAWAEIARTSER